MSNLQAIRGKIRSEITSFLDFVWRKYTTDNVWPTTWQVHSHFGKRHVIEWLREVNGSILCERESRAGNTYELTTVGVLLTSEGTMIRQLLERFIDYLRELYKSNPQKQSVTSNEVSAALKLSVSDSELLGKMINMSELYSGSMSRGAGSWNAGILTKIEDCYDEVDTGAFLEELVLKDYDGSRPVFAEQRRRTFMSGQEFAGTNSVAVLDSISNSRIDIDPTNRRYQAFVSSTYLDLIPERQEVLHALLQTMCIPVGMELFPATGWEQLKLIKKIIDDSDYYILILGGRYGSKPEGSDISFTELEFDYAVQQRKHIMCFPHKNVSQLKAEFVEDNDEGKKRLLAFRKKAMTRRTCAPWANPYELASHVKTAIMHAIREVPQPGWVRARSIAPASERQFSNPIAADVPVASVSERLEIPIRFSYHVVTDPSNKWKSLARQKEERNIHRTLDEVLLLLAKRLEQPANSSSLKGSLENRLGSQICEELKVRDPREIVRFQCSVKRAVFQRCLDKLHAADFVTTKLALRAAKDKRPQWILTKTGAKYASKLRSSL